MEKKHTCPSHLNFPIHPDQTKVHRVISINKTVMILSHWVWKHFVIDKYILSGVVILRWFNYLNLLK